MAIETNIGTSKEAVRTLRAPLEPFTAESHRNHQNYSMYIQQLQFPKKAVEPLSTFHSALDVVAMEGRRGGIDYHDLDLLFVNRNESHCQLVQFSGASFYATDFVVDRFPVNGKEVQATPFGFDFGYTRNEVIDIPSGSTVYLAAIGRHRDGSDEAKPMFDPSDPEQVQQHYVAALIDECYEAARESRKNIAAEKPRARKIGHGILGKLFGSKVAQ